MTIDEINNIVIEDLNLSSPEWDVYRKCPHTAIRNNNIYNTHNDDILENAAEKCNSIIRYYEDEHTARAYSVSAYSEGYMIMYNKHEKRFYAKILQEDDGCWFVPHWKEEYDNFSEPKNDFIARITETVSIFNANFNYEKQSNK